MGDDDIFERIIFQFFSSAEEAISAGWFIHAHHQKIITMKKLKIKKIDIRSHSNAYGVQIVGGVTRCWWIQTSTRDGNPNEGYYHCEER